MSAIISVKITATDVTAIIRLLLEYILGAGCVVGTIKFIVVNFNKLAKYFVIV